MRPNGRVTRSRVVRSEWSKMWSLRSTWHTMGLSTLMAYLFAGIVGLAVNYGDATKIQMDPVLVSLAGLNFAQLTIPILGIMMMTNEYSSGTIRPTLMAVPKRLWVLYGKISVLALTTFPLFLVVAYTTLPLAQAFLDGSHLEASFSTPGAKRALLGASLSLTLLGILGLGIGALVRSTPMAIGLFVSVLTVLPQALSILPYGWVKRVTGYMPLKASESLMSASPGAMHASPKEAFFALVIWATISVVVSGVMLSRRDA